MNRDWVVVIKNADGRPCAWGTSATIEAARERAEAEWHAHACYPGERRGRTVVRRLTDIVETEVAS